jgi:hypothetical protein
MHRPSILGLLGRLDIAPPAHVRDTVGDPVVQHLDASRHVAERCRIQDEQVWKACCLHAEIGSRPVRPLPPERNALRAADIESRERPGYRIEPGSEDDHVQRIVHIPRPYPVRGDPLDRRFAQIDQRHVVAIEDLVVSALERDALGAERMVLRNELFRHRRVADPLADLVAHELGVNLVSFRIGHDVAEVAEPLREARLRPQFLEPRHPLLLRHLEHRARVEVMNESGGRLPGPPEDLRIARLDLPLRLRIDRPVAKAARNSWACAERR